MKNTILTIALLVAGCADSTTFISNPISKTKFSRIPIAECGGTGLFIEAGRDVNFNGALDSEEVESSSFMCDGINGADGTLIEVVEPCENSAVHNEVLFRLVDGTFIAWFKNLGLTVLEEDTTYVTTDAQTCQFKIVNGQLVRL